MPYHLAMPPERTRRISTAPAGVHRPRTARGGARAALAALALCACSTGEADPGARHLLLISIDTLRADALSMYGNPRGTSPRLDAWAAEGAVFESAWTHSPKTAPAHMSMLTGLPPRVHEVGNLGTAGASSLSEDVSTLAEVLSEAGFLNAGFSGGGNVAGEMGFDRGYADWLDRPGPLASRLAQAYRWLETEALDHREDGGRWHLFFHTYHVHDPYLPGRAYLERFVDPDYGGELIGDREELERRIAEGDDRAPNAAPSKQLVSNFWRRFRHGNEADLAYLEDLYLAGVAEADQEFGRFLTRATERGLLDGALVVITSDHGEEFGEHGQVRHEQLWREVSHVPLVVRTPDGLGAGLRVPEPVRHVDLLPSVLALLGVPDWGPLGSPVRLGESWAGWLSGDPRGLERAVFAEHRSRREHDLDLWSLRVEDRAWHRAKHVSGVYDVTLDPDEQRPLEDPELWAVGERNAASERARLDLLAAQYAPADTEAVLDEARRAELEALGYLEEDE